MLIASPHSSSRLLTLLSIAVQHVPRLLSHTPPDPGLGSSSTLHTFARRAAEHHDVEFIVFACLIPVLVLLSGVFAGLTLGYMSLDETQLHVLSISGTPKQREYANKIKPIRANGHLLLVTLLLANMIVNESLPVISDPVLGGGVQSVVVSTVLIVIFAEIIPQSICTRHGLYLGAKMASTTQVLIYALWIIAWPVAKILELVLGEHHGIIYRRSELKELIAMHSTNATHGGDLKNDTVTIIGATLDLQEKVVSQAMTPISDVFMLSIEDKLDYETLKQICLTGHSRVPVYEEVTIPAVPLGEIPSDHVVKEGMVTVKKIIGILLVKNCVLLDPNDAVPIRKIPLNKVLFVPRNEPLLGILDKFQEGRSHIAVVSRHSKDTAVSVKKAVKTGLTQRIRATVGIADSDSSDEDDETASGEETLKSDTESGQESSHNHGTKNRGGWRRRKSKRTRKGDLEMGTIKSNEASGSDGTKDGQSAPKGGLQFGINGREQAMPADAVLAKEGAKEFYAAFDPAVMPLGIITLEDVLEELIGEEIYDEFDPEGAQALYNPSPAVIVAQTGTDAQHPILKRKGSAPQLTDISASLTDATVPSPGGTTPNKSSLLPGPLLRPLNVKGLDFIRSRSAPPTQRGKKPPVPYSLDMAATPPSSTAHNSPRVVGLTDLPITDEFDDNDEKKHSEVIVDDGLTSSPVYPHMAQDEWVQGSAHDFTNPTAPTTMTASTTPTGTRFKPAATIISPTFSAESVTPSFRTAPQGMATPTSSLEAMLRKRRAAAAAATATTVMTGNPVLGTALLTSMNATGVPQGGAGPSVRAPGGLNVAKGARFKSSPIGGGHSNGVIVAEQVKEGLKGSNPQQQQSPQQPDEVDADAVDDCTDVPEVPRSE